MSVKDKALKWWVEKTERDEYVASSKEFPQRQREVLVKSKFLFPLIKGYWILKRPEDEIGEVFLLLYWQIIEKVLSRFSHWSIRGMSALRVLNGDQASQKHLLVRTKKKTNRKVSLPTGFNISLVYDPRFDERLVKKIEIAGRNIPVDIPEKVLIDVSKLKSSFEIQGFIAGTPFDLRTLEAIYAKNPKPIVFKRLAGMAKEADRPDLVSGLEKIVEIHTHYRVSRRKKIEPKLMVKKATITHSWVIHQERQLQEFEKTLEKHFAAKTKEIKKRPLEQLLSQAREHKKYDTYHSTTLEGYRITPEEVEVLLSGSLPKSRKAQGYNNVEKIKNRMAILGYSAAFDFVINKIQEDFGRQGMSEDFIKDVYYHLFKPSADAGIIDYLSLVSYRTMPAFIRGTPYVPPSYEKLSELMASYIFLINKIKNPIVKAVLAHYFFVTIHPYSDGNGRTARLLMNYLLLTSGYPWATIRVDNRVRYFEALKKGQIDDNILVFGDFIVEIFES
ncbi:MAG TPA: Fic family protein [Actinobacteria bacterium]|nr:Fic family protein [Actinomycetota bacterium]